MLQVRHRLLFVLTVLCLCAHAWAIDPTITISEPGTPGSGSISIHFSDSAGNDYTETTQYDALSTPAAIASMLADRFTHDYLCAAGNCTGGLGAHANGSVLTLQLNNGAIFGTPAIANPSSPFVLTPAGWPSTIPIITWGTPSSITYGTALSSTTQLNAIAIDPITGLSIPGSFAYSPTVGSILSAGAHTLFTTFIPSDPSMYAAASATTNLVVNPSALTLSVATSNPSSIFNQSVTFTATMSSATNGTVMFYDAGLPIGVAIINGATTTYVTSALSVGTHTIKATWIGNENFSVATSGSITQIVNQSNASTKVIQTVVGNGLGGSSGDGGAATAAAIYANNVTVDSDGNIYITDGCRVRKVLASSGIISTIAGTGTCGYTGDGNLAISAQVYAGSLGVDSSMNVYLMDAGTGRIRKINGSTGVISTIAGNGTKGYSGDGGLATAAKIYPIDLAMDGSGNIYIVDIANRIRKINASTGIISTVAGNGTCYQGSAGFNNVIATSAEICPAGIAVASNGNFYIADFWSSIIEKVDASTGLITTIAGLGSVIGFGGDGGLAINAVLQYPTRIAVDGSSNVYIVDYYNSRVREIDASNGIITTIAGNGTQGFSGDGGLATSAELAESLGIATDVSGNVYIADQAGGRVREVGYFETTPVLNFTAIPEQAYGVAPFAVTAKSASPGGVTYSVTSGPATISGDIVAITGTGIVVLAASQAATLNYTTASASTSFLVTPNTMPVMPTITWNPPSPIPYGTPLSQAQLNAHSSVPGVFAYKPGPGEVLPPGTQVLSATFTPSDPTMYATTDITINLQVYTGTESAMQIYSYCIPGPSNPNCIAASSGYSPNGNVMQYIDSVNGTWSITHPTNNSSGYDVLNRISQAMWTPVIGTPKYLCWTYDSFGNRKRQATSDAAFTNAAGEDCAYGGTQLDDIQASFDEGPPSMNNHTNRIVSLNGITPQYDLAGSMQNDGHATYLYDGDGRVCAVVTSPVSGGFALTQYIYDSHGNRVGKGTNTDINAGCDTSGSTFALTNVYILGASNEQLTELDGQGRWIHTNVFASGELIATYDAQGLHYHMSDWLGTRRVQADYAGNIEQTYPSLPYGEMPVGQNLGATEHHFTGKERDVESGNDYFGARYYASSMGRWISPDDSLDGAIMEVPQSWNKYSYEYNRPLYGTDPDGRCPPCVGALVGGLIEGGVDLTKQLMKNGGDISKVNPYEVGAHVAGGAVAGALAVATGGATLVESAVVGDAAAGVTSNVVGGIVSRGLDPNAPPGDALAGDKVAEDAVVGLAGGLAGHVASNSVHVPDEPIHNGLGSVGAVRRDAAKFAKYTSALRQQITRSSIASGAVGHVHDAVNYLDNLAKQWFLSGPHCHTEQSSITIQDGSGNALQTVPGAPHEVCSY